jgi:O-antigen/teichoic acid export membrane protein
MIPKIKQFAGSNPLFASAFNLMISAGVTAVFGFVFWLVVARVYNAEAVGLATTLLSVSGLLSLLGLAGFDTVFVRFLPRSSHRNEQIDGGLAVSGLVSIVLALGFCALVSVISPKLSFVRSNPWYIAIFAVSTLLATWNTLTNAVLVAYRKTSFVVVINIIFSAVKMILPFAVHSGGAMMIFAFAGLAQLVNVGLSVAALIKYFDYRPGFKIRLDVLKETRRYGFTVYIGQVLNLLPDSALPIIVVDKIGASAAAFFYIAFTVANLMYTIAFSTTQATLAEASHDEEHLLEHFKKGLRITTSLLIPVTVLVIVLCPWVLAVFGEQYRHGATPLLRILSVSSLIVMLYSAFCALFKLTHDLKGLLVTTAVNSVAIVGGVFVASHKFGLNGVGWAWVIGNAASVVVALFFARKWLRGKTS